MATLMPLCAGLVGPKSENVEISLVLLLFFERAKGEGTSIFGPYSFWLGTVICARGRI